MTAAPLLLLHCNGSGEVDKFKLTQRGESHYYHAPRQSAKIEIWAEMQAPESSLNLSARPCTVCFHSSFFHTKVLLICEGNSKQTGATSIFCKYQFVTNCFNTTFPRSLHPTVCIWPSQFAWWKTSNRGNRPRQGSRPLNLDVKLYKTAVSTSILWAERRDISMDIQPEQCLIPLLVTYLGSSLGDHLGSSHSKTELKSMKLFVCLSACRLVQLFFPKRQSALYTSFFPWSHFLLFPISPLRWVDRS